MSDLDDFLATTLARQVQAEEALHNGDPEPRLAMWSTKDPVTVLGALRSASGWDQVSRLFRWLGSGFSDCTSYRFELLAAGVSGDLPTPSATSTPRCPGTAPHWTPIPCASRTPIVARTASGGSSTAMPTPPRSIRRLSVRTSPGGGLGYECSDRAGS